MGTGEGLLTWAVAIGGSFFMVIVIMIGLWMLARRAWGELITFLILAVIVAGFIFLPTETKNIFIWLWRQTFGGGGA